MSALPKYRLDACESVDAAVFCSDMLHIPEQREEFAEYLARWNRAMGSSANSAEDKFHAYVAAWVGEAAMRELRVRYNAERMGKTP